MDDDSTPSLASQHAQSPPPTPQLGIHASLRASLQSLTTTALQANNESLQPAQELNSQKSICEGPHNQQLTESRSEEDSGPEDDLRPEVDSRPEEDLRPEVDLRAEVDLKSEADSKPEVNQADKTTDKRLMVPSLVVDDVDDEDEEDDESISRTSSLATASGPSLPFVHHNYNMQQQQQQQQQQQPRLQPQHSLGLDSTQVHPVYRTYRRRWIGLAGLALLNLLVSWGWLSFAAISSTTAAWFGLTSEAPVNWLSTSILFAYLVSAPLVAPVLEKRGVRAAMLLCATLMVAGNWVRYAGTATRQFAPTMVGQILIGLAQPFALSAATHYTDLWFTSRSRVSANAIISVANPLGGAVAQLVGPPVVTKPSELKTFVLITAVVASAGAAVTAFAPGHPPSPPCASAATTKLGLRKSLVTLLQMPAFVAALCMFSVYVGLFNAYSTFINQIMQPYGYSSDEAGYTGALLIVAGLVGVAVVSPIVDRTHCYLLLFYTCLPVIAGCFVSLMYTSTRDTQLAGPFIVSGVLGACSFSLLPTILEWVQEQTAPVSPSVSCTLLWCGGQLMGAVFIIAMDSLKYAPTQGDPPGNMHRALVFQAVWGCVGVVPLFFLRTVSRANVRVAIDGRRGGGGMRSAEARMEEEEEEELEREEQEQEGEEEEEEEQIGISECSSSIEIPIEHHVYGVDSVLNK